MFKVTKFVVVPYEVQKGREVRGEAQQFYTQGEAESARAAMRKRCCRVELYEVSGWPVQDLWDRPRRLAGR